MTDRLYCTLDELIDDLEIMGIKSWKESQALDKIKAVSDLIDEEIGQFIPITESRNLDGNGRLDLYVDPLLAITTLTIDGTSIASTQYVLYPLSRYWENGPYNRLTVDPDATQMSVWMREIDVITIAGRWGKYEKTEATGASVENATQIEAAGTSLLVGDASRISLGAVLLVGSEQMLVTTREAATDSTADTAEAIDVSEEEIDVTDGTKVKVGEVIKIDFEQMRVLDIATNTLLVERGFNGTKRVAHLTAVGVFVYRTFTVKRGINGTTAAIHLNGVAISRYVPPADIKQLCIQMAALKLKLAQTGYAGRSGNPEMGETFYYSEIPKIYDTLKAKYRIITL